MKSGLILEGGAMRGMFTCGVIDVLMENNINFDGASGISAGAVFGCNYKSKQIGRGIRYNKNYCNDKRYCSFKSLIKTGDLYNAEFCYHTLPEKLDIFDKKAFKENDMEFYIGATNVDTGDIMFHKCSDGEDLDILWMRASASMPIVSKPVIVGDLRLLDGGIACPVPYKVMFENGYDKNLVVLTQPKGYRKKESKQKLLRLFLHKYKKISDAMKVRSSVYNLQMDEIDSLEEKNEILVIRPSKPLNIGKSEKDPSELERVYQEGRAEALKYIDKIKEFIGK